MIPDPLAGGEGGLARDVSGGASRADGLSCWLCGHTIIDPPRIIGQAHAGRMRVAHRYCLRVLGELDLNLPPSAA